MCLIDLFTQYKKNLVLIIGIIFFIFNLFFNVLYFWDEIWAWHLLMVFQIQPLSMLWTIGPLLLFIWSCCGGGYWLCLVLTLISSALGSVGNKNDDPASKVVETNDAQKFAEQMGIRLFETSAKDNINVEDVSQACQTHHL